MNILPRALVQTWLRLRIMLRHTTFADQYLACRAVAQGAPLAQDTLTVGQQQIQCGRN